MAKRSVTVTQNNQDKAWELEYQLIMANIKNLVLGEKYKYPKLIENLKLEFKKSGATRQNQIKRIIAYLDWDSRTGLYNGIRKGAEVMGAVQKKTSNSEYLESIQCCFLINLNDMIIERPTQEVFPISKTQLMRMCEMVSEGYELTKSRSQKKLACEMIGCSEEQLNVTRTKLRNDCVDIGEGMLRQLQKQKYLVAEEVTVFFKKLVDKDGLPVVNEKGKQKLQYENANIKDKKVLMETQTEILSEMVQKVKPQYRMYYIQVNGLYEVFQRNVCTRMKKKGYDIHGYYDGYLIAPNKSKTDFNLEKVLDNLLTAHLLNTKSEVVKKLITSTDKKFLECFKENTFGEDNREEMIKAITGRIVYHDEDFNNALRKNKEEQEQKEEELLRKQRELMEQKEKIERELREMKLAQ